MLQCDSFPHNRHLMMCMCLETSDNLPEANSVCMLAHHWHSCAGDKVFHCKFFKKPRRKRLLGNVRQCTACEVLAAYKQGRRFSPNLRVLASEYGLQYAFLCQIAGASAFVAGKNFATSERQFTSRAHFRSLCSLPARAGRRQVGMSAAQCVDATKRPYSYGQ